MGRPGKYSPDVRERFVRLAQERTAKPNAMPASAVAWLPTTVAS